MRIVHAIPALTKGGAEKVVVDLANEAHRRGHQVAIVTGYPADPRLIQDRLDPQIAVQSIAGRAGDKLSAYGGLPGWLWRHRAWLGTQDVIHCHLTHAALLGSLLRLQRRVLGGSRPAVVETFHGVGMPIRARQRWLAANLARGRDGFVLMAEDPFWSNWQTRHPAIPSAVIPNGLALDQSADLAAAQLWRQAAGIPDEVAVIGTIGRIRAERNPLATLDAFAAAAQLVPAAHFVMGGDGPMLEAVRTGAAERGLAGRLHLPGLVLDPALALANIDLYLTMNVGPITGIAGLEAAAAGCPLIALQARSDYHPAPDDWIWSHQSSDLVGAELARLLNDPSGRAALAKRQRAHVAAEFSVAAMQDAYEALYRRAIATAN